MSRASISQEQTPAPIRALPAAVAAVILLASVTPVPVFPSPAAAQITRLNVTGTWDGNFWGGSDFHLTQDADRVWGTFTYGNGEGFARGSWNDGRLILILTPTTAQIGGACDSRKILVIDAKGSVTSLEPYALDLGNNQVLAGRMKRNSPSAGEAVEYPYEAELKNCGQLAPMISSSIRTPTS